MHEKDHMDRMLESSLSSYGDAGADTGLAERILARVSSEHKSQARPFRWSDRFLLWAALPAAACLLLSLFLFRSGRTWETQESVRVQQSATTAGSRASDVTNFTSAKKASTSPIRHTQLRPVTHVGKFADRPKLDVFPQPQPLSAEEQALYAFATQVPEEQRRAVVAARKDDDAPLNIAAISIQPLELHDNGKN